MTMESGTGPIDADGHVVEVDTTLRDFLEEPYRSRARHYSSEVAMVPTDGFDRNLGDKFSRAGGRTAREWLDALELGGLELAVLYPSLGLHLGLARDPDLAVAFSRAHNRWLDEVICSQGEGRLLGACLLPPHDPDEAAAELRRVAAGTDFVAAMLPADGAYLFGHKRFDPIYEAARDTDITVAVHAGIANLGPGLELFPKFIQAHAIAHPFGILRQFTSMMFEGVFERFGDVRFAFLEAGATWVPWYLDRLDEEYRLRGVEEAPTMTRSPSEYVTDGRQIFFGVEADERMLPQTLTAVGDDIFMYASDWPHWDNEYPRSLEEIMSREDLDDRQRHNLIRGAACRCYRI